MSQNNRAGGKLTAFIFARGGSKGVPRKNVRMVAGKPLISYAVEAALAAHHVARVMVSTDSDEIAAVAQKAGAEIPFLRPADLAGDRSSELFAWRHAIEHMRARGTPLDLFLSVPATAPLRAPKDIDAAVNRFLTLAETDMPADLVVTAIEARSNPYFSMLRTTEAPWLGLAAQTNDSDPTRRQDAPKVFEITPAAYVADPAYVESTDHLLAGRVAHTLIPPERALDIDTPFDLHLADLLLRNPFSH